MINYFIKPIKRSVEWSKIKLIVLDCDGVLTDGRIIYGNEGQELKHFNAQDGLGLMLVQYSDLEVAIITGRKSQALERRCQDLKIKHLYQEVSRKLECLDSLISKLGLGYDKVAYMGDDWNDALCMRKVAFSACPANAFPDIRKVVDYVCIRPGGHGAVRELIEYILNKKGIYERTVANYIEQIKSGQ